MPKIILKKSSVTSKVPTANDLVHGELAINYADGKLFYKNASNSVQEFSANVANALTIGTGLSGTSYNGSLPVTIALASNYGDTTNPYASKTAGYVLAAPTGTNGQPTFRALAASDIPTLNQNTTGTASNVTGTVAIANGGTGQTTKTNAFDALSPLTTKGDLVVHDGTNNIRVPIGTNGYVLTADSTQASGLKWAAGGGGGGGITDVSQDTSPELGGNLALSGYNIVSGATTIINGSNGSVNLNGTVKGNIVPDSNETYDLGSATYKFRDLYLSGTTINLGSSTISADGNAIALPAGSTIGGINVGTLTLKGAVAAVGDLPANNNTLGDAYVVTNFNPDKLYFWDENQWVDLGSFQGPQGDVGPQGPRGGISYTFSSTTSNSDPGSGIIRYNNSTIASVTSIYIDNLDSTSTNQTSWYSTWDDSTSSVKGFLILQSYTISGTVNNIFKVTGNVTDQTGYYSIPVEHVSGSIPTNNDVLVVQFIRTGDVGQTGSGSTVTVREVNSGGVVETITGVTTLSFDADGGFDVVDQGSGQVKVTMNSTFKYWEVAGQTTIVASGLDTIKFVPSNGISITTNTTANPKEIGFSLSASLDNLSDVTITSPTNGQVLKYNGTSWVNGTDSGGIALTDISVTDSGGDGSLSYNNTTGVITYTGPSASDVRAHFTAGTGITITSGQIATTITQYTDSAARSSISVTDTGGEGSLSYDSGTGVITYTGPSFSGLEQTSNKNTANGYAGLDSNGKVASAQLPSYVDDVLEYADLANLPGTGETGKIYVAQDTGKVYRWSGSAYVEISPSPGSTDSVTEGSTNLYFTTQRARDAFSAGTGITITSGQIATTITQYTDSAARSSISVTDSGGDGSLGYDSSTGIITYTGPSATEVRAHFSAGTGITITSGQIANTGVISINGSTGTITGIANASDTTYIGTTAIALNRSSAAQSLTGITSIQLPGSTSGNITIQATATAGTNTITLPSTTGTVITTGDTGTVTDAMLAGSISNGKLTNSSITINGTSVSLGGTRTINLSELGTVSITSPTNGQVLSYNGTNWVNSTGGGGGGASALDDLTDVVITSPVTNHILKYNGTNWVNAVSNSTNYLTKTLEYVGVLSVNNGIRKWWINNTFTITRILAFLDLAPTGAGVIIRINKNGVSSTTLTVNAASASATSSVSIALVQGDYITVDITQVGSTFAGSDLAVVFEYS